MAFLRTTRDLGQAFAGPPGFPGDGLHMATDGLDADLVEEVDPEDLLVRQPVVGTLDLNDTDLAVLRVPHGQIRKSRPENIR